MKNKFVRMYIGRIFKIIIVAKNWYHDQHTTSENEYNVLHWQALVLLINDFSACKKKTQQQQQQQKAIAYNNILKEK
jgi:hypothetical protein